MGGETWAVPEMDRKRMGTGERKILIIHEPVIEQGIWRIRTNQDLYICTYHFLCAIIIIYVYNASI
jgi:hypothetical protein